MSLVGSRGDYFDAQDVSLENITDSLIFRQLIGVNPISFEYDVTKKYLSNKTIEKLVSLVDAKFEISMMATESEFEDLAELALTTNGVLPKKQWRVTMLSQTITGGGARSTSTITGEGFITDFKVIDNSIDEIRLEFILDFETATDSTGVIAIT